MLRILQIGADDLKPCVAFLARTKDAKLTVFDPDSRHLERAQANLPKRGDIHMLDAEGLADLGTYDVIIATDAIHRLPGPAALEQIRDCTRTAWPVDRHRTETHLVSRFRRWAETRLVHGKPC